MIPRPHLIVGPQPAKGRAPCRPNVAVLYVTPDGTIVTRRSPRTHRLLRLAGVCQRYEVDLHDHLRTVELRTDPLPARGNAFCFETRLDIGFRVTDPVEVLRRHVVDGCEVVYQYLSTLLRPVTRQFSIEESDRAEEAINRLFRRDVPLKEGLTIFRCLARLTPDASARAYLTARSEADRRLEIGQLEHELSMGATEHEVRVKAVSHRGELDRRAAALASLGARPMDPYQVLLLHLAEHPDDISGAADLMLKVWEAALNREDSRDERAVDLLKELLDRNVIRAADAAAFRDEMTRRVRAATTPEPPTVPLLRPWDGGPILPTGPLRAAPDRPQESEVVQPVPVQTSDVWPVYVVVDESPAFSPHLDCVNESLRRLLRELDHDPECTRALRLTVLGYAGTTEQRLRPETPRSNGQLPLLQVRADARYGPAFDLLRELVDADVCALDGEGHDVHRPVVFFFTGGGPDDEPNWREAHRRLLDRGRPAPHVVACGVGPVPWRLLAGVATQPGYCLSVTGPDMDGDLRRFMTVLRSSLLTGARAVGTGRGDIHLDDFDEFRF
jgi:uncharacterized protein YegL